MQQMRPESERNLPQWQIDALDRQRVEHRRNVLENPALWERLNVIENKLDRIFALLVAHK